MVPKTSYPPAYQHPQLTQPLTPSSAQQQLANFLAQTRRKPYLHPDALLLTSGVAYSAHSGPNGGLALHYLRRIEAGLRGESLMAESADMLAEQYGEGEGEGVELPEGDDEKLDAAIEARSSGALKRKRNLDLSEVGQWAEESSEAAFGDVTHAGAGAIQPDWEDEGAYERSQRPLEGEVGDREGAPAIAQNGPAPIVLTEKRVLSDKDKAARRAAKKERRKTEKKEKTTG